ncbi:uncharacterized protein LOC128227584 isoform X2 [Mya arenaria]|uniref:uncharacterized protein LOC128227584 isoform X2 n=1 Tax=Mya arenaria TaxID=6604 RepID=UPI0022E9710C|nr:uncharacterized protein LOC128227584 isoform X2 [Mya arenaria]
MDPPQSLSKSRTQKFHKLFKSVPENEYPVDYFSCAFIGDILLQGNLYVSQNWFCFYSRIRGRGRLLEIPMDLVISITPEKTALIFPNAIGLQTKNEKYAFGSFIARDSTYRFLVSMWKKSHETKSSGGTTDGNVGANGDTFKAPKMLKKSKSTPDAQQTKNEFLDSKYSSSVLHSNSKSDSSDQSDSSICIQESNSLDISDVDQDLSPRSDSSPQHLPATKPPKPPRRRLPQNLVAVSARKAEMEGRRLQFPYSIVHCIDRKRTVQAIQKSAVKLQNIPKTNFLLSVCTVLYKSYNDMMDMQSSLRDSTAQHIHNVLRANIKILQEINSSLQHLQKGYFSNSAEEACKAGKC